MSNNPNTDKWKKNNQNLPLIRKKENEEIKVSDIVSQAEEIVNNFVQKKTSQMPHVKSLYLLLTAASILTVAVGYYLLFIRL